MGEKSATEQIDDIIVMYGGWKAETLSSLRNTIKEADPGIVEEVKWKMANRPWGLPVWSHNGIVCFAEIWKDNVKLLFPKGAQLTDSNNLFNARLNSKDIRAIEFKETTIVNDKPLRELVIQALEINTKTKMDS